MKRLAEIQDEVGQCERQVGEANDNLKEAQQHLEELEKRYEVIGVDADAQAEGAVVCLESPRRRLRPAAG